jgi:hypothetical protein
MFEIFIGPAGIFEHVAEPPLDPVPVDEVVVDELLELHDASPSASTPAATGRNPRRKPALRNCPMCGPFEVGYQTLVTYCRFVYETYVQLSNL